MPKPPVGPGRQFSLACWEVCIFTQTVAYANNGRKTIKQASCPFDPRTHEMNGGTVCRYARGCVSSADLAPPPFVGVPSACGPGLAWTGPASVAPLPGPLQSAVWHAAFISILLESALHTATQQQPGLPHTRRISRLFSRGKNMPPSARLVPAQPAPSQSLLHSFGWGAGSQPRYL